MRRHLLARWPNGHLLEDAVGVLVVHDSQLISFKWTSEWSYLDLLVLFNLTEVVLNLAQKLKSKFVLLLKCSGVALNGVLLYAHEVLSNAEIGGYLLVEDDLSA
jgi:hypothetical protein